MRELKVKIPEENSELATQLLEKLGGEVTVKKSIKNNVASKKKSVKKIASAKKKKIPRKIDHTFLFGKWKDFDIDPKKLREESW